MTSAQFITVRETAQLLAVSEKMVMDLIDQRHLQAYRIANKFLRLKKSDVLTLRNTGKVTPKEHTHAYTIGERVRDFFYFNDFYLFMGALIAWLLLIILFPTQ